MKTILHYGSPLSNSVLLTPTKPVEYIDKKVHQHIQQMKDVLVHNSDAAAALAANQVGMNCRIFVYFDGPHRDIRSVINPIILETNGRHLDIEGCLSFPNTWVAVERFKDIKVSYVDFLTLEERVQDLSGFTARLFQHEIEHLDGKTFINNLNEEEKNEFLARYARNNRPSKDPSRRYRP